MNQNTLENIKKLLNEGKTYQEIGNEVGLTKQRVHQLSKTFGIKPLQIRQLSKQQKYFDKWGHKNNTSDLYQICREKFRRKKANSTLEWSLTFGELDWPTHCPVLGLELDYFAETRAENSPSFDRIDNSKGYVTGNVKIISWRANRIKNDGTVEEHEKVIEYLRTRK
jgi:hypothetical protein